MISKLSCFSFTMIRFYFLVAPHMACGILGPWPGIKPMLPALEPWSLNPWATREVPNCSPPLKRRNTDLQAFAFPLLRVISRNSHRVLNFTRNLQVLVQGLKHWLVLQACNNTSDRKHADSVLEKYVTEIVMSIVTTFFSSPFSDQSTTLQVRNMNRDAGNSQEILGRRTWCWFWSEWLWTSQPSAKHW